MTMNFTKSTIKYNCLKENPYSLLKIHSYQDKITIQIYNVRRNPDHFFRRLLIFHTSNLQK